MKNDLSKLTKAEIISLKIKSLSLDRIKTLTPGQIRWLMEEQINDFNQAQRGALSQRQRTALWETESSFRKAKTHVPQKVVSDEEFKAICLGQAAINYARKTLIYRSANQEEDIDANTARDGETLIQGRNISGTRLLHHSLEELEKTQPGISQNHIAGLSAGLAGQYGTGNCPQYRDTVFCFLVKFGYPGLTITRCSSLVEDHALVMIEGVSADGTRFKVACDAWPAHDAQAVLWEDHPSHYGQGEVDEAYRAKSQFTITPENMGTDLQEEAFNQIDPNVLKMIKPAGLVPTLSPKEVEIRKRQGNVFRDQHTTISEQFQGYSNNDDRARFLNREETLAADSLNVNVDESWTAKLMPVFESPLTSSEISLNSQLDWRTFPKINLSQEEIEKLRTDAEQTITQSTQRARYLPKPSLYQRMLHGAKQLMGSSYSELRKLDEMARAAGMSQGIQLESPADKLEPESQVVLISEDKQRAYIRRNRPGERHNHWKIAMIDETQQVQVGETMKAVKDLRLNDVVGGKNVKAASQGLHGNDEIQPCVPGPSTPGQGRK